MNLNSRDEDVFLKRLTAIVEANLSDERFGVSELAEKTGMSRSFLHRRLKGLTNQSVSQFIREIRLKKAKELLELGELTVSEVAYNVGFGSPSYFIKCYHEKFGFAPGEYIKYANEVSGENGLLSNKTIFHRKYRFFFLALVLIISVGTGIYFIFFNTKNEPSLLPTDKSIAILPLRNVGTDPDIQSLADGVMEDILNRLAQVGALTVKSRNSSEVYRNSVKTTPEIAKELGVSYLVEGTILKEGENVRIYIQLIDAVNDKHLWAEQFDRDLSGIFTFISVVSRQIANQLETALSVNELEEIEKVYTENPEAYQLYLKGRFFWYRRTKDDLSRSEDYFNQALAIDPNYSLAWAGLADTYLIMTYWRWLPKDEGLKKSKECALKSLEIDNNVSEAHAVLGGIADWFDFNWKEAESELKLAIELNPNNAVAHQYYAEYLQKKGNFDEAIKQCNMAIELEPNAPTFYSVRSECYYNEGNYLQSLNDDKKITELNKYYGSPYLRNFKIFILQKENLKAVEELQTILSIYDPGYLKRNLLEDIYEKSGKEGIVHYMIDWLLTKDTDDKSSGFVINELLIARLYSLIGDWDNVFNYLGTLYLKPDYATRLPFIKYGIDFKPISNDPRFIALIKKMGLEDL